MRRLSGGAAAASKLMSAMADGRAGRSARLDRYGEPRHRLVLESATLRSGPQQLDSTTTSAGAGTRRAETVIPTYRPTSCASPQ